MDVKEAVQVAKAYVSDLFYDEGIRNVGLEEVDCSPEGDMWTVTVGFSRPWDTNTGSFASVLQSVQARSYKVVRVRDEDKMVVSIKSKSVA